MGFQESSPAPQFKSIKSLVLSHLYCPTLILIHDYWKNHSFDYKDVGQKVMSLLFNMQSRFVTAFLPRSKCLLISQLQSLSTVILEPTKINSITLSIFSPSICHEVMGLDAMILVSWMLSVKPVFYFHLSPSSGGSLVSLLFLPLEWYHLHIWGYWYFSQQSWFQLMIHPAWHFISYTLHIS